MDPVVRKAADDVPTGKYPTVIRRREMPEFLVSSPGGTRIRIVVRSENTLDVQVWGQGSAEFALCTRDAARTLVLALTEVLAAEQADTPAVVKVP